MVRRRAPAIVLDAQNDPRTFKPIVEPSRSRSYVGAPVMPEGRVIGFVHADHYFSERQVDLLDRDTLWTFAQGFGLVYERAVLLERLRSQRDQVRQMVSATDAVDGRAVRRRDPPRQREQRRGRRRAHRRLAVRRAGIASRVAADAARAGGPGADGARRHQRRDRERARDLRGHGQVPRQAHPAQAARGQPRGGRLALPALLHRQRAAGRRSRTAPWGSSARRAPAGPRPGSSTVSW